MKASTTKTKALVLAGLVAAVGVGAGAAGAFGSVDVPEPTLPTVASWEDGGGDHAPVGQDRVVPGIDPLAPPPEVAELWDAYLRTQRCLEGEGFGFVGPVPLSDGSGLQYLVSSPEGGPALAASNPCEDPLKSGAAAFSRAASAEARRALVQEFASTGRCLGLDGAPFEAVVADEAVPARNLDAEQQVMTRLMQSEAVDDRCSGRPR